MSRPPTFLFKGLWDWKNDQGNGLKDNASMKKRKGRKIVCVGVCVCEREREEVVYRSLTPGTSLCLQIEQLFSSSSNHKFFLPFSLFHKTFLFVVVLSRSWSSETFRERTEDSINVWPSDFTTRWRWTFFSSTSEVRPLKVEPRLLEGCLFGHS